VLACASFLTAVQPAASDQSGRDHKQAAQGIGFGVYDPEHRFAGSDWLAIEHVFLSWRESAGPEWRAAIAYAAAHNRMLMVTVEPWTAHNRAAATLFGDILVGIYDSDIDRVCGDLGRIGAPIFVRWGHEMEDVTGRYPWAQKDSRGYVDAYRYFVSRCRSRVGQAYFVWSPKGKSNMNEYYPGADYVDYVGVSVYGLPKWDLDHYGRLIGFNERFQEIYGFASRFGKPMMIAELGMGKEPDYRRRWQAEIALAATKFPLLRLVVYFAAQDPEPWPDSYGAPDWRIAPAEFEGKTN
jgi:endoglucanase